MDAEKLDRIIRKLARKYSGEITFGDLYDEMWVGVLEADPGFSDAVYRVIAERRAIDYLRSKRSNYSYANEVKHFSLESMESAGFQIDADGNVYRPDWCGHEAADGAGWDE